LDHDASLLPHSEPIPAPPPSALRNIFIGKDGLRAGWSLLIFILLFAAMGFCTRLIMQKFYPALGHSPKPGMEVPASFMFFGEMIPFLIVLVVTCILSKIEHRPNSVYGLGGTRKLGHFLAGLCWGVACLSILIFTLWKTGLLVFDGRLLFGGDILRYGAIWLVGFLLVGLLEEYLTRGYLQFTLTRGLAGLYQWIFKTRHSQALGFWTAAIIFSILFGLGHGHNPGESPIGLLSAGLAAMVFCFSLWRTGSLWWAVGFHTTWDWGQSFLYGVADSGMMAQHHLLATHPVGAPILSGGATGPEGSIYILAVLAFAALIILFTLPKVPYGETLRIAP
jgi:membrane protease YdiL (CAAX protease family)